jgi:hypothetical protein
MSHRRLAQEHRGPPILGFALESWAAFVLWSNRRNWWGWFIAFGSLLCFVRLGISLHREDEGREREYRQYLEHIRTLPDRGLKARAIIAWGAAPGHRPGTDCGLKVRAKCNPNPTSPAIHTHNVAPAAGTGTPGTTHSGTPRNLVKPPNLCKSRPCRTIQTRSKIRQNGR